MRKSATEFASNEMHLLTMYCGWKASLILSYGDWTIYNLSKELNQSTSLAWHTGNNCSDIFNVCLEKDKLVSDCHVYVKLAEIDAKLSLNMALHPIECLNGNFVSIFQTQAVKQKEMESQAKQSTLTFIV